MANPSNLNNLGNQVSYRTVSWTDQVIRVWGSDFRAPDHGMYEWSNGRKFDSTDRGTTGIYNAQLGTNYLTIDTNYPDMVSNDHLLQDNLGRIIKSNG